MNDVIKMFEKPLPSTRSGAFFNAFSYPTKISPESIAVYIASITKPGDIISIIKPGDIISIIVIFVCTKFMFRLNEKVASFFDKIER